MLLTVVAEAASADAPWASDPTLLAHLEATVPRHDLADVLRRALAFEGLAISRILSGHSEERESLSPSERLFLRLFTPTAANKVIRQLLAWMDLVEVPYCSAPDRFESKPPEGFVGQAAQGFVPTLRSAIVRNQAVLALRQLTFAALEVRTTAAMTGAYPPDAGSVAALASPSPLTGLPVAYRWVPTAERCSTYPEPPSRSRTQATSSGAWSSPSPSPRRPPGGEADRRSGTGTGTRLLRSRQAVAAEGAAPGSGRVSPHAEAAVTGMAVAPRGRLW